jgi:hypothetical protein
MDLRRLPVRVIALIAAYALALQGMFAAAGPAVPSALAAQLSLLCSGDSTPGSSHAPDHLARCQALCSALGQAAAGPLPPDSVSALAGPHVASRLVPAGVRVVLAADSRGPQLPRGPPSI